MRSFLILLSVSGCSLGRVSSETCSTNDQCKSAFGWDAVCGDDGYCETLEVPERCERTFPEDLWDNRRAYDDAIILGSLYSLGYLDEVQSIELPFRELEAAGAKLEGRPFAIVECDIRDFDDSSLGTSGYEDRLTYDEANVALAPWLVGELGVDVIVGPDGSSATASAYSSVFDAGLEALFMAPASTGLALTDLDGSPSEEDPGYIWRTAPSDAFQGEFMARYIYEQMNIHDAGVIFSTGSYGEGLLSVFRGTFEALGGTVTPYSFSENSGLPGALVSEAANGGHGVVVFIGLPESVPLFLDSAAQNAQFTGGDVKIFLADGGHNLDLYTESETDYSSLIPHIVGTSPYVEKQGTVFRQFKSSYGTTYAESDPDLGNYAAYAYDASWLMVSAITWSIYQEGGVSPIGVGRGMRNISAPLDNEDAGLNLTTSTWVQSIRTSFEAGEPVNVTGASGPLDYDESTGETAAPVEVWTIVGDSEATWEFSSPGYYQPDGTFVSATAP